MAYELPGQRSETVRRANLSAIRESCATWASLTLRARTRTGLTRSAVRGLIGELALAGLVSEERGTPRARPDVPRRCPAQPALRIVLALEITVDSLAVAAVAIGGEVLDVVRLDGLATGVGRRPVADLAALARAVLRRLPDTDGMIGIGHRVVGIVRRDAGVVTMAPNLGWRDVPLAERLADALGRRCRSPWPTRPTSARWPSCAGRRRRRAARPVPLRRGRGGRGPDRRRPAAHRRARVRRRGRAHAGQPRGRTCRCGSVGRWETEVGEGALLRRAGHPPDAGPRGGRGRPQRGRRRRRPTCSRRSTPSGAGWASGWPASSTSSTRRWWSSAGSSAASIRSWRRGCRASSTGSRYRRRARRSVWRFRPRSATTPRSSGLPSWPSSRCSPTPSLWTRPAVATA